MNINLLSVKSSTPTWFSKIVLLILLSLSLLFFLVAATYKIHLPGLQMDETLFINSALGAVNNDFIYKKLFGIPLMLMPYIGALKSYIYYPIFQIFEVSPATIRFPVIIISLLTLVVSFYLGSLLLGRWWAALLVILMATDPAFIYTTKLDWGPVVLMNFFKLTSLFFIFNILDRKISCKKVSLFSWLLACSLLLGLFDKLNFIWFIIAAILATITIYHEKLIQIFLLCRKQLALSGALFISLFSLMVVFLIVPALGLGKDSPEGYQSFWQRFDHIRALYQSTINGESVYNMVFAEKLVYPSQIYSITTLLIVITIVVIILKRMRFSIFSQDKFLGEYREPRNSSEYLHSLYVFFLILFAVIYAQILSTKQAGGPHHIMMLFPIYHILNIIAFPIILNFFKSWKYIFISVLVTLSLLFGGLISSQVRVVYQYTQALTSGESFSNIWSPSIYQLSDFLKSRSADVDKIVSVDWGMHNQLFALSGSEERYKYFDYWPNFKDFELLSTQDKKYLFETILEGKNILVVSHALGSEVMEGNRGNFLELAKSFSIEPKLIYKIFNGEHPLFEVFSCTDKASSA